MNLIAYGTLRTGEERFDIVKPYLEEAKEVALKGYKMFDLEYFPAIIKEENSEIVAEIFKLNFESKEEEEAFLKYLDHIETTMYSRKTIKVNNLKAYIYVATEELFEFLQINPNHLPVIKDWKRREG